jgi:pSer/pThr/pTyr-binding forkhead associated (FHA) protein
MPAAAITLTVLKGWYEGQCYVFDRPAQCTIGRGNDCTIHFPLNPAHRDVSRHHCALDIDPPNVCVRDLGSLNGTYVNGEKIGQRFEDQPPADRDPKTLAEHELHPGDEIRVGVTVFRVGMLVSCGAGDSHSQSVPTGTHENHL